MHLLAGEVARIDDGTSAVDLAQSPGDIVVLSAADTELALLAQAVRRRSARPSFRLCNLMRLAHPMSVDLYLDKTAAAAQLVVVRMMGGAGYWSYGLDRLRALARAGGPRLIVVPGDSRWDPALEAFSTETPERCRRLWRYLVEGGLVNAAEALAFMAGLIATESAPSEPVILPRCGCYRPGQGAVSLEAAIAGLPEARPLAAIVFYRSILQGGATAPIDALIAALDGEGIAALALFVASLKDGDSQDFVSGTLAAAPPSIVLNTTAFAVSSMGASHHGTVLDAPGRPVLQVILAGSSEAEWRESARGLLPRDLTMNVVLPEVDGRIGTRAISFKAEAYDAPTDSHIATYEPVADRVRFVAKQAAAWVRLAAKPAHERRVAVVLSNYPNRESRIGSAVGLDTAASAVRLAAAMADKGYRLDGFPEHHATLVSAFQSDAAAGHRDGEAHGQAWISAEDYAAFLSSLPIAAQTSIVARWGRPEDDPGLEAGGFPLRALRYGNLVVAVQPSRGNDGEAKASLHDAALVPPHGYIAFHAWLRDIFRADAVVHLGKHGNLEWLPGKALALSADCWPELCLGPTPLIYPFIVNDPGEGAQAKRRTSAVIVDHLMPAMTRAELQGPLAALETLIDEYALAAGVDRRRREHLEREIAATAAAAGLDRELGLSPAAPGETLQALDAYLCELKEMQIRDGLHVLGASPEGRARLDTLVAMARSPRPGGRREDASLHRAIAADLGLGGFDPLDGDLGTDWSGPRPAALAAISDAPWRTVGDTVERIESLALRLLEAAAGERGSAFGPATHGPKTGPITNPDMRRGARDSGPSRNDGDAGPPGPATAAVLDWIGHELAPALDASGKAELEAVLAALDGRFVPPGPSGAPTRGRPEVLPTGRNFYTVDIRAVPTRAAWVLGRAAADAMALRYFQDEGEWPRSVAISAWGTSNMRTGGDDIAEAMALIGAEPVWETGTGRVTGFRVMTLSELGRPRIDVTLRISGMFRDAFPEQIELMASAFRAVAGLDEDDHANPLAAARRAGVAGARIFGVRPGAYGAGIEAIIDRGGWDGRSELAEAFLRFGGYAYGGGAGGREASAELTALLRKVDAIVQNQDNREHDILDSADYAEFQGGLAAAVEHLSGRAPRLYHGDHARPDRPVVRALGEELNRVVRGRAANPKWIAGMMRHGYRGAMEMAVAVDLLFAYAALTDAAGDHHFDQLYEAYIADDAVRTFIADVNPAALRDMAERFREAIARGLWSPRWNSAHDRLAALTGARKEAAE
ncbi:MAG TPA: cobaltochelatase subunit CobN [Bauldia sp.]|nr:cobaltochelatase subunit CobN [Bauldia sp.]